jgi:hypothetical protein
MKSEIGWDVSDSRSRLPGNYTARIGLLVVSRIHPILQGNGQGRLERVRLDATVANHAGCRTHRDQHSTCQLHFTNNGGGTKDRAGQEHVKVKENRK